MASVTQTETPEEALTRIQSMGFGKNDAIVIMAFADRGLDPEDIDPRQNVLTFRAWKGAGRQVAKGAIGVPVTVWIARKNSKGAETTEETPLDDSKSPVWGKKKPTGGMWPKTTRLFHVSQTVSQGAEKGTRPEAWNNPALVWEGTYEPLQHALQLDTGEVLWVKEESMSEQPAPVVPPELPEDFDPWPDFTR